MSEIKIQDFLETDIKSAVKIEEMCFSKPWSENSFKSARFSYDQSIPNALYVTVYSSKRQAEKGIQMFSFSYLPEDGDRTYNIVNDSDKFMLKLEK